MNCRELERWLDDGGAPGRYVEAMAHARICAHCSAVLGGVDELEHLLARPASDLPDGFADRLMAKVAVTPQVPARIPVMELLPFFQTVPWWVRVALEPASLLAMLLAAVLVWRGTALFALASGAAAQLAAWVPGAFASVAAAGHPTWLGLDPMALTAMALGLAPVALMGSQVIYRWSAALMGPHRARRIAR